VALGHRNCNWLDGQLLTYYWKQKLSMAKTKRFYWPALDRLCQHIQITDFSHKSTEYSFIKQELKSATHTWRQIKRNALRLREEFFLEQASLLADRMQATKDNAYKLILNAERSKQVFKKIKHS
jgi:hypothetical protein